MPPREATPLCWLRIFCQYHGPTCRGERFQPQQLNNWLACISLGHHSHSVRSICDFEIKWPNFGCDMKWLCWSSSSWFMLLNPFLALRIHISVRSKPTDLWQHILEQWQPERVWSSSSSSRDNLVAGSSLDFLFLNHNKFRSGRPFQVFSVWKNAQKEALGCVCLSAQRFKMKWNEMRWHLLCQRSLCQSCQLPKSWHKFRRSAS